MKKRNAKILNGLLPLITLFCVIAVWASVAVIVGKEYLLPTVSATLKELLVLFTKAKFYIALLGTLLRTIISFVLSFVLAFIFAFFSKRSKTFNSVISPIVAVLRALPTIAVILILLVWTNSKVAPVLVTMLVVLPTTYTHLKSAFLGVEKAVVEASMVDGAGEKEIFKYIEIPLIAPAIFSSVGSGFSLNFKLMVAAEVLSATARSIGSMLNSASYNVETAQMIALVLVSVICGLVIESIFNALSRKIEN